MRVFKVKQLTHATMSALAIWGLSWTGVTSADSQVLEEVTIIGSKVELDSVSG